MFSAFITNSLNFGPTRADPDIYIRKNFCKGQPYYEYLLVYVKDILVVGHAPEEVMKGIGEQFEIKNGEYGPPTTYLGASISQVQLDDGSICWSVESQNYVKATINTIKALLIEEGCELKGGKGSQKFRPLPPSYRPELYETPQCNKEHASQFRQIIGIFLWAIKLGRFDILTEVSLLAQYQASPCVGHLEALYLIANSYAEIQCNKMALIFEPLPLMSPYSYQGTGKIYMGMLLRRTHQICGYLSGSQ